MIRKSWAAVLLVGFVTLLTVGQSLALQRHRGRVRFRPAPRAVVIGGFRPYRGPRPFFFGGYGGFGYYGVGYRNFRPFGSVDFNVTPKQSLVYVDGALLGSADDFNGGFFGSTAKLTPGTHDVRIVAPDGTEVHRKIYVMPGRELNFNYRF